MSLRPGIQQPEAGAGSFFVYRLRMVTGKDGNPLNEVELVCDSLINNGGILLDRTVIKYIPELSVVKVKVGDKICLSEGDFARLTAALFEVLERKFAEL
jgi:hypothetical protein